MEWTEDAPAKAGYYWFCPKAPPGVPVIVYVLMCDKSYEVKGMLFPTPQDFYNEGWWLGPLLLPPRIDIKPKPLRLVKASSAHY
jgi:hypothetical protein